MIADPLRDFAEKFGSMDFGERLCDMPTFCPECGAKGDE